MFFYEIKPTSLKSKGLRYPLWLNFHPRSVIHLLLSLLNISREVLLTANQARTWSQPMYMFCLNKLLQKWWSPSHYIYHATFFVSIILITQRYHVTYTADEIWSGLETWHSFSYISKSWPYTHCTVCDIIVDTVIILALTWRVIRVFLTSLIPFTKLRAKVSHQYPLPTIWWRGDMETLSILLTFCEGNSSVTGGFPS